MWYRRLSVDIGLVITKLSRWKPHVRFHLHLRENFPVVRVLRKRHRSFSKGLRSHRAVAPPEELGQGESPWEITLCVT